MDAERMIKVSVLYGRSECRAWLKPKVSPDGSIRIVGMGSRTDFDRDGNITAHKVEPTGAVLIFPPSSPKKTPWYRRLFS